jgi:hypothetical protein
MAAGFAGGQAGDVNWPSTVKTVLESDTRHTAKEIRRPQLEPPIQHAIKKPRVRRAGAPSPQWPLMGGGGAAAFAGDIRVFGPSP